MMPAFLAAGSPGCRGTLLLLPDDSGVDSRIVSCLLIRVDSGPMT